MKTNMAVTCTTCTVSPSMRSIVLFMHFINTFYVCFILESSLLYLIKAFCFKDCNEFLIMSLSHVFYKGNLTMCFSWMRCGWMWFSCDAKAVRKDKLFPPQSLSSGHSKNLPIGIILSFVLLTSMKLPSLLTFCSFVLCFFHALHCYSFGGNGSHSTDLTIKTE